jgi:hypothetical protein
VPKNLKEQKKNKLLNTFLQITTMEKNIGKRDRLFRFSVAIVLGILAYSKIIPADLAIPVYIIAGVIALTGLSRICLLYKPFGISTCREQ